MKPRISVVLPVYNATGFYTRALGSILAQTEAAHEILIVDDHSTDDTFEHVRQAISGNPSIRLLRTERNGGPSAARNVGIDQATGDWIAVLDADDAYLPDRLAQLGSFVSQDPTLAVAADNLSYFDADAGQETGCTAVRETRPSNAITIATYLRHTQADGKGFDWGLMKPVFRRDFLVEHGLRYREDMRHGEDFQMMLEILAAGGRFRICRTVGYVYTQRQGSISKRASTLTRTSIAYVALARSARALALDPRFSANPEARSLLQRRARGLMRLDDAHFFSVSIRQRAIGAILRRTVARPVFLLRAIAQGVHAIIRRLHR